MNEFTRNQLFNEAFDLLKRAQALILGARANHEKKAAEQQKKAA